VLEDALTRGFLESLKISTDKMDPTSEVMADTHTLVTRIFALMALVYLHLVCHGFQQLELLTRISETMEILQLDTSKQLFSAMVTPLFMIASVARQGDEQDFFREVFSSPQLLDPLIIQRQRILPILEVIWSSRQTISDFAWEDCVELTKDIFLI
jgi:C6 transcription factor Pro1